MITDERRRRVKENQYCVVEKGEGGKGKEECIHPNFGVAASATATHTNWRREGEEVGFNFSVWLMGHFLPFSSPSEEYGISEFPPNADGRRNYHVHDMREKYNMCNHNKRPATGV